MAVHGDCCALSGPGRDSQINREVIWRRDRQRKSDAAARRIVCLLQDRATRGARLPAYAGWDVQIDIDTILCAKIGADSIIRRNLWKGSRTAGPPVVLIPTILRVRKDADVALACGSMVVGVVERRTVLQDRLDAQGHVVKHALHAVAVARIARERQQVPHHLEVRIRTAARLEMPVSRAQAVAQFALAWLHEGFIRPPAAGGVALIF